MEEIAFPSEEAPFRNMEIAVIGLGLIGGSLAMALKKLNPKKIWGVDIDPGVLKKAEELKVIDRGFIDGAAVLPDSDLVIACLPPAETVNFVRQHMACFKPKALLTDICGLKQRIVSEIKLCLRPDLDFVGGHPLAGREGSGFDQASAEIFQGANYILTPVGARQENVELLVSLVKGIGCKTVIYMDPEEHDRIIALTSHLPHIIAAALMNSNSLARAGKFVGGSFRDATRVADMNVDLWKELLLDNKDNILPQLDIFTENLNKIKRALQEANAGALQELLQQASESRKQL